MRRRVLGIDADRVAVVGNRAIVFALVEIGVATPVVRQRIAWIELDCLVVIRDGAIVVVLVAPGVAAAVVRSGVLWIELDCLVVIRDGAVGIALGAPGVATAVVRMGVLWIELDCLVVVRDGAVVVALVAIAVAAVIEGDREILVRFLAGLDDCGAPADLKVGRGALLVDAPSPCLRLLGAGAVPREDTRGKKSRNYPSPFHGLPVPALEPWRCVAVK